jgi:uncharacterized protein YjbI with pentapeptide repeats
MAVLHESIEFVGNAELPKGWEDDVFRYCTFTGLDVDGAAFEGILNGCRVNDSSWYWGLFNTTTFVRVEFNGCVFRGSGFAGCLFAECRFVNCKFLRDNLHAACTFDGCRWYDCEQTECEGLPRQFAAESKRCTQ